MNNENLTRSNIDLLVSRVEQNCSLRRQCFIARLKVLKYLHRLDWCLESRACNNHFYFTSVSVNV